MFGSNILEVAIGIIFIFLLVSTICSAVREGIESWLKTRAAYLEHGIRQLFTDPRNAPHQKAGFGNDIARQLYEHPQIYGLFGGEYKAGTNTTSPPVFARGGELPSYIPSKNFALALMDIASGGPQGDNIDATTGAPMVSLVAMRQSVNHLANPVVRNLLLNAIDSAQGDLNKVQANIEAWYNSSMDRVSGWYKRSTQYIIFGIACFVTVALNINTISIANYLSQNEAATKVLIERAAVISKDSTYANRSFKEINADLDKLKLPIGWDAGWASWELHPGSPSSFWNSFIGPVIGLLITAFAATLGAPFWFDMLNKVMVIRSTVKPHEKSREEGSQDNPPSNRPQVIVNNPPLAPAVTGHPIVDTEDQDNCHFVAVDLTDDEDLPVAVGGVANAGKGGLA